MRGRGFLAGALVLALGATLTGCGVLGSSGEDKRITYWATNMAPTVEEDEQILGRHLKDFTERTGIEVDLEVIPWSDLWDRIQQAISSGNGPDVLNIGNTWSTSLYETGAFLTLGLLEMEAIGGAEKFLPSSMAATGPRYEDPIAVPLYGQAYGLYYNTRMFAEAGIEEPPATWDEFIDVAQKLTKDTDGDGTPDQWGITLGGADVGVNSHFAFILGRQHGGSLFGDDGSPQFDSEPQVDAVKRYIDLMAEHRVVDPADAVIQNFDSNQAFADGRAAMTIAQTNTLGALESAGFSDFAVAPVPVLDPRPQGGLDIQTMVAGVNVTVFGNTDDRRSSLQLVEHLTSRVVQTELNKEYGTLPVTLDSYVDPAFTEGDLGVFGTILRDFAEPFPQIPETGRMEELIGNAMVELWAEAASGEVTEEDVRQAMEAAGTEMAASAGATD
ncbi:ABC transporter substrate-binding protein [Streptomyces aidingensis]|uniref:Multiple sugar transport system substrate-binding protein n=1 Tax=Streptomyces aidingensis TaxID=910347 RepID=A0A1I1K533_9ACTN|nr:sugar ABC transporter substrate-binding protein [Streptomyces aidingensis]SFC55964.1 multiple sugar transport system substrate-binding protein [Streptomyces aidingensis]